MAGIINTGGSEGSGWGNPSTAEFAAEDDDASLDLYSDLIVDEQAGQSPRPSQNSNQATAVTELEKLKQEILRLKQQNEKLKNESEETSRRLQKKDNELSQLKKRTLSCGRCCSSVDLQDTGSWQGHSPFSPHSSFSSQPRAKPIAATATCQHKKRRISPELIVKYSDSNVSNFSDNASSRVGKGDTFHEYLKIFPDSRGGDSQDASECGEAVGGRSKAVSEQSQAVFGGKTLTEPTQFPVPFHISDEISQREEKPETDGVSLAVPDLMLEEVQHDAMSKLVAEIADKSRLKSANTNQEKPVDVLEERPSSEIPTLKNGNVSNIKTSGYVDLVKVSATKSKSTKDILEKSEVEKKKESMSIIISSEKEKYKSHSNGRPDVKHRSRSPTKSTVQAHRHCEDTVVTNPRQSVFDPVKGIWSEVLSQADVDQSEKHPRPSSKDVCSNARNETPDQKASAHMKDRHSESYNARPDKEKSSSHSKSNRDKYSHSVSSKSDKGKSSQSLSMKSDKDKSTQSLNSRSNKDKSSQSLHSKSDKDKSSKSHHSKSDKAKSSKSLDTKSEKGKSSYSLQSKSDKEKTDSHKHHTHDGSDKQQHKERQPSKSQHQDRNRHHSAPRVNSTTSSDRQTSDKGDTRSRSKSKDRYSKSKSKENVQDDQRSKASSTSTEKQEDWDATVPSTPRHRAVFEANHAFQNFTETLGASSKSKSVPTDKKRDQVDCDREKKTHRDEKNSVIVEGRQLDTQVSVSSCRVEQSAQKASSHGSLSSKSRPKDLVPKKIDSVCEETHVSTTPLQEIQKNENQTDSHREARTHSKHKDRQRSSKVKTKEVSSVKHSSRETHRHSEGANKVVKVAKGNGSTMVPSQDKDITQVVRDKLTATKDNTISHLPEQKELGTKETNDTDSCTEGYHFTRGADIREDVCAESNLDDLLPNTSPEDAEEQQSSSGSKMTSKEVQSKTKSDGNIEKCDKAKPGVHVKKKRHHSSSSSKEKPTVKAEDKKKENADSSGARDKSDKAESVRKSKGLNLPCASACTGLLQPFKIPKKKTVTPAVPSIAETPATEPPSECQVPQASGDDKAGKSLKKVVIPEEAKTSTATEPALYCQDSRLADRSYPVNSPLVQGTASYCQDPRLADKTYPMNLQGTGGHHPPGVCPTLLDLVRTPPAAKLPSRQDTGPGAMYTTTPLMDGTPIDVHEPMEIDQVDAKLSDMPNVAAQRQLQPVNTLPDILLNLVSKAKAIEEVAETSKEVPETDISLRRQQQTPVLLKETAISDNATSIEQTEEQKVYEKEIANLQTDTKVPAVEVPKDDGTGKKVRTTYPVPKPTRVVQMASDDERLLAYMCLAKRRDKQSLINRKKTERAERKRVGAKKPVEESLAGEAIYGGCVPSSVVDIQEEPEQPSHPELSPEEMEELWNQGVDVTDPDVLAEYWRMRYASEHVQRDTSENIEVYSNEEMRPPLYIEGADMTTEDGTETTGKVSEPCNSDDEQMDHSVIVPEDRPEPQLNSGKDCLVPENNKDCLIETKTIDSEGLPLNKSAELPEQNVEEPEEQASFDGETPTTVDNSVITHLGKDQLQSDLELSLSLSVSGSEDSMEANPGLPEAQEKGKAGSETGSVKEESCESLHGENSQKNHTQMSDTYSNELTPTEHDEQADVLEKINRSVESVQEQPSPKGDLEDSHPAMEPAEEDYIQVSTVQAAVPKLDPEKLTEKPTQAVHINECDLKLFGKDSVRQDSSERENILICGGNNNGAEKIMRSLDLNSQSRKHMELELFGEDSMQISKDASDFVKHNQQLVQTSFVTDKDENIKNQKTFICEGNNRGAEKRKESPDLDALKLSQKRMELELFGEDSMQLSMDASDVTKHNKQLVQTNYVSDQLEQLLPKAEDDRDSGDDSDLDIGDSEFAIDPSCVSTQIDLSEGDSAESWVNSSQSGPEDVEHTTSVHQVLESSADICNTPVVPVGSTPVDNSIIVMMKSDLNDLNVPSNIVENKVPNKDIKCNGFAENVEGDTTEPNYSTERDKVSIDAKQCSDVKKEQYSVGKDESIDVGNQTVMKLPGGTYCTEQGPSKMSKHSKSSVVTDEIGDNVKLKRSEGAMVQEPLTKNDDLEVTDEGKDADITEESLIDIEESSDVSSEGVCAGDEMSEDQDSTLIDDPSKDDDAVVNDMCSLASESGGSSLHCSSATEDELDELDEDIPFNDSLDKTLLEDKSPEMAGVNDDEGKESGCEDVLELHAGDLSMFDEESMPPSEVNRTPRRSPRKKLSTSTPRTTKPLRTPTKDRSTPRSTKPSRTPTKDKSTPTSRVRNTLSHRAPIPKKKESVENKKPLEREIEEGEAVSDEEEYTPRRKDQKSGRLSRTPPHHHSSKKRRRSVSKERDSKRVCSDSNRRTASGLSRRHDSPSSRYVSSRDRTSSHRDSRHHPRRSASPKHASTSRKSGRSENYTHSHRDSKRENPRIDVSARHNSRRIR